MMVAVMKIIHFSSIQFFIICVPNQQLQGQLQTGDSVDISNYIMDKHNIKSKTNYRQAPRKKYINTKKVNKQIKMKRGNKNMTRNYISHNIRIRKSKQSKKDEER
jgi:hypothetical protein